jgi:hypothetical protein
MSIELSMFEKSKQSQSEKLESARKEWEKTLAEQFANERIQKRNITQKAKVNESKKIGKLMAKNVINAYDKNFVF